MSPSELHVTVRRTGGVAGIVRTWTVSTADLAPELGAELRRLVASGGSAAAATAPPAPGQADAFGYECETRDETGLCRYAVDRSASASARALIDFVVAHGRR